MSEDTESVRASRFALALSTTPCWKCKFETRVACIVVGPGHAIADGDDETIESDASALTSVDAINPEAQQAVLVFAPWMKWIESKTAGVRYLGNACQRCDALQGDHFLHSEPGGAFWPETEAARRKIEIHWIEVPILARAGGMSWGVSWLD